MIKVTSYFEVDARAEMAYDLDTDEPCEAYIQVSTEHPKLTSSVGEVHKAHKTMIAIQMGWPEDYLKEISQDEYIQKTEEEDE